METVDLPNETFTAIKVTAVKVLIKYYRKRLFIRIFPLLHC